MVAGRRITDEATLDVAKMVFAGSINLDILSALRGQGIHAVGLSGVDGDILHVRRRPPTEMRDDATGETRMVDFGHVGDIEDVDTSLLSLLVENGYVPVLSSLGGDAEGNVYNINADTVASALARDLGASKLISLTTVRGLLRDADDPSTLVSRMTVSEARAALEEGAIAGGMRPKVLSLVEAVEGGVECGHILSGVEQNTLLVELFTKEGVGTLIESDARRASR
jgi:acetylglutamate kinase